MRLPVADGPAVRAAAGRLFARHRGTFVLIAVLHTLAAVAGLVGPWLLGRLVDAVTEGTTSSYVTTVVAVGAGAVVAQAVLRRYAQRLSMVFGETVFAELREDLVETVTSLPLSTVERAGTGDLVARTTNDVDRIQHAVRFGVPQLLVAVVTLVLPAVAAGVVAPRVARPRRRAARCTPGRPAPCSRTCRRSGSSPPGARPRRSAPAACP